MSFDYVSDDLNLPFEETYRFWIQNLKPADIRAMLSLKEDFELREILEDDYYQYVSYQLMNQGRKI